MKHKELFFRVTLTFIYIVFPIIMLLPVMFGGAIETAVEFIKIVCFSIRDIWSNNKQM